MIISRSNVVLRVLASCMVLLMSEVCLAQFSEEAVLSLETRKGVQIHIFSELAPLDINQIHSWLLRVEDASGKPLEAATIEVIGGMPEHDHGLPTQPKITAEIAAGQYLLEGVRFHMPGKWQLDIEIGYAGTTETATIDFQL